MGLCYDSYSSCQHEGQQETRSMTAHKDSSTTAAWASSGQNMNRNIFKIGLWNFKYASGKAHQRIIFIIKAEWVFRSAIKHCHKNAGCFHWSSESKKLHIDSRIFIWLYGYEMINVSNCAGALSLDFIFTLWGKTNRFAFTVKYLIEVRQEKRIIFNTVYCTSQSIC